MKLLKRDRTKLAGILRDLKEGHAFLMAESTAIMVDTTMTSADVFTSHYYPGKRYVGIAKTIGSKLCYLETGIADLEQALTVEESPV